MAQHADASDALSLTKPHALVFPWAGQGHIIPMLQFSRKLAANGICVTFVNTEHNHVRLIRTLSNEETLGVRLVGIPDGLPAEHSRTANIFELCRALENMGNVLEELIERMRQGGRPFTCIISDFFTLFTQDVANRLGIPRAAFWTQSVASYASDLIVSKGYRPPIEITDGAVHYNSDYLITCIPGTPPVRLNDLNTFMQSLDPSDYLFNYIVSPFQRLGEATWVLINTFEELESSGLDALRKEHDIHAVGPLLPSSFCTNSLKPDARDAVGLWPTEHGCLQWLDAQAPSSVLYVSFGSISILTQRDIEEFALGLEASGQSFIWVVRPDLMCGLSAVFPEGFKERVESRAIFISWAPQRQVLCHPSVGGFLTHCGWNSTLESISAGVPMVGWPCFADQMLNRRCIVDLWKVGLSLEAGKDGSIARKEVELKVRTLMASDEGKEIRGRVNGLKAAAMGAMEDGGSSNKEIQRFVRSVKEEYSS